MKEDTNPEFPSLEQLPDGAFVLKIKVRTKFAVFLHTVVADRAKKRGVSQNNFLTQVLADFLGKELLLERKTKTTPPRTVHASGAWLWIPLEKRQSILEALRLLQWSPVNFIIKEMVEQHGLPKKAVKAFVLQALLFGLEDEALLSSRMTWDEAKDSLRKS